MIIYSIDERNGQRTETSAITNHFLNKNWVYTYTGLQHKLGGTLLT